MKIETQNLRELPVTQPVTIVLTSREEVDEMRNALCILKYNTTGRGELLHLSELYDKLCLVLNRTIGADND